MNVGYYICEKDHERIYDGGIYLSTDRSALAVIAVAFAMGSLLGMALAALFKNK